MNALTTDPNRLVTCVVKIVINHMNAISNFATDVIRWAIKHMSAEETLLKNVKSVGKLDILA